MTSKTNAVVYLIPSTLDEQAIGVIPFYVLDAVKNCQVFFTENERSARRFLKKLWKEMVIDDYEWFTIHKAEEQVRNDFLSRLKEGKNIGILSEAGCPGVADPGQLLVAAAQDAGVLIKPLVGPNSMLLALMGSGMNGQHFRFTGYLPIDTSERIRVIREMEQDSQKTGCTYLFIETPYRNNQLVEVLLKTCRSTTRLCIAANLTGVNEFIKTKTMQQWRERVPGLHKQPAIFCLSAAAAFT